MLLDLNMLEDLKDLLLLLLLLHLLLHSGHLAVIRCRLASLGVSAAHHQTAATAAAALVGGQRHSFLLVFLLTRLSLTLDEKQKQQTKTLN